MDRATWQHILRGDRFMREGECMNETGAFSVTVEVEFILFVIPNTYICGTYLWKVDKEALRCNRGNHGCSSFASTGACNVSHFTENLLLRKK